MMLPVAGMFRKLANTCTKAKSKRIQEMQQVIAKTVSFNENALEPTNDTLTNYFNKNSNIAPSSYLRHQ
jgi:hypothetical protein